MIKHHENVGLNTANLSGMFEAMSDVLSDYAQNALILFNYSTKPIETEAEVLERAELMDELMDMATSETDVCMVYAHAISDRIEEFETNHLIMPKVPAVEMLKGLMDIKELKQSDLKHIAPQSVISDILNGKRNINLAQVKGFSEYFNLPFETFID